MKIELLEKGETNKITIFLLMCCMYVYIYIYVVVCILLDSNLYANVTCIWSLTNYLHK